MPPVSVCHHVSTIGQLFLPMTRRYHIQASGIDRLSHGAEQPQRLERVLLDVVIAPLHEGPDGGRRRVQNCHLVLVDDLPETLFVGMVRRALVQEGCPTVGENSVDDVRVARDPADVGRAPVRVLILQIKDVLGRDRAVRQVATGRVQYALRLARRSGRVEQKQRMLRIELCRAALRGGLRHDVLPPDVPLLLHGNAVVRAPVDDHALDAGGALEGLVDHFLQLDDPASTPASVGRHDELGLGVVHAVPDRIC